jgi:hypothetical protein
MGVCQMQGKPAIFGTSDILRLSVDTRSWAVSFGLKTVYALNTNNDLMALEWNTVAEVQPATFDAILAQGGAVTMSFTGSPDSVYTLERTLDFRDWQELSTLQTDSSGAGVATDDWVSDPSRKPSSFYRLVGPQ